MDSFSMMSARDSERFCFIGFNESVGPRLSVQAGILKGTDFGTPAKIKRGARQRSPYCSILL